LVEKKTWRETRGSEKPRERREEYLRQKRGEVEDYGGKKGVQTRVRQGTISSVLDGKNGPSNLPLREKKSIENIERARKSIDMTGGKNLFARLGLEGGVKQKGGP